MLLYISYIISMYAQLSISHNSISPSGNTQKSVIQHKLSKSKLRYANLVSHIVQRYINSLCKNNSCPCTHEYIFSHQFKSLNLTFPKVLKNRLSVCKHLSIHQFDLLLHKLPVQFPSMPMCPLT